ncbi:MAG TPA: energy transducer TonB [Candidatus Acidoferrales bacterium]|nr:energy transducer TonB [Candidatus Acidoferrales bacterium]
MIPLFLPHRFEAVPRYWVTALTMPPVEPWKPLPIRKAVIKRAAPKPEPEVVEAPKPKIYTPVITTPIAHPAAIVPKKQLPQEAVELPKAVLASAALPELKKPRAPVQTGGFGDPDGAPRNNRTDMNPNIEQVGSFDLPSGPGKGNGKGGAKGVVATVGFGNGIASGSGSGNHGTVRQGVFADEHAVARPKMERTAAAINTREVQVSFIPKPAYTATARAKKIEGDVLLQVVFSASGRVIVQKVVRGLGYGLDDAAETAAREIRFRPAEQDGQPVDFPAVVRIQFALAY